MQLAFWDVAQPVLAGLAGMLGVYTIEGALDALRRRGLCPARWQR